MEQSLRALRAFDEVIDFGAKGAAREGVRRVAPEADGAPVLDGDLPRASIRTIVWTRTLNDVDGAGLKHRTLAHGFDVHLLAPHRLALHDLEHLRGQGLGHF